LKDGNKGVYGCPEHVSVKCLRHRGNLPLLTELQRDMFSVTCLLGASSCGSVLFHAGEGVQVYDKYIEDAERTGDQELAEFFREIRDEDTQRTQKAKSLLSQR